MLNRSGISKSTYASTKQILANVELQSSVGCVVPQLLGVEVGTKKIAKAGTPIKVNLMNRGVAVEKADGTKAMNAVLLHDVDVTDGAENGTMLVDGYVDINKIDVTVEEAAKTALTRILFMKGL